VRSGKPEQSPFPDLSPAATHRRLLDGINALEDDYLRFRPFAHWGPTTDNVSSFAFREGDHLVLTFEFWREGHLRQHPEVAGKVLVTELPAAEFTGILDPLIVMLGQGPGVDLQAQTGRRL
jgi:hypothetical protein